MKLLLEQYIEKMLAKAHYELDQETGDWCAWISALPGVYAQADSIEATREDLSEVIEEYVYLSLREGTDIPEFSLVSQSPLLYAQGA